jgi:hypothetical protein
MERPSQVSPRFLGRMVGVGYLVLLAAGFDLFAVVGRLVRSDAATAAARIQSHANVFLAGFAAALLGSAAYVVVTALLYRLYEPVNRTLSLTAAFLSLTGCVVQAFGLVFHYAPIFVLGGEPYLGAFSPAQRQALALIFLRCYVEAYNISLVFFGFYLLTLGYLTFRSTFLPRWLGVMVALGAGWTVYLYPPLARAISPYVLLSSVGELLLVVWLAVKGVDERRWHEAAGAQG